MKSSLQALSPPIISLYTPNEISLSFILVLDDTCKVIIYLTIVVLSAHEVTLVTSLLDLLYFMWLFTSCPAAIADISESSPARTEPATIVANCLEFAPGVSLLAPLTPSKFKQADCDASCVPPPTVPTCIIKKILHK